jgi:hypothetical protein
LQAPCLGRKGGLDMQPAWREISGTW